MPQTASVIAMIYFMYHHNLGQEDLCLMDAVNFSTDIGGIGEGNHKYRDHNDLTRKKMGTTFLIPGI